MAYGNEQGFGNAGAPTVQPETEEERQRRLAQTQNFTTPPEGARVGPPQITPDSYRDNQYLGWGGRGDMRNPDGSNAYGTSPIDEDLRRYQRMGADINPLGAQIDQTQANETRGLQGQGIDLIQRRANGGITPAQYMLGRQTRGAVNAVRSNAASIRGGAAARAAAGQAATQLGGRIAAQGAEDRRALAAREQADAAGQFLGASTEQRGQDVGVATDQAKLNAQQNALNENRDQFYEGLQYNTKKATADAALGRSAADIAATNASRAQSQTEAAQARADAKQTASAVYGTVAGGAAAYGATRQPNGATKPYDPNNPNSDPRTKMNVRDLSTSGIVTKRGIAPLHEGVRLGRREDEYNGRYLPSPFSSRPDIISGTDAAPKKRSLEDAIAEGHDDIDINPYGAKREGSLFGGKMSETAERGYASRREGQLGYMFGRAPEADYGRLKGDVTAQYVGQAPGTADFNDVSNKPLDKFSQEVSMSDPKTKKSAKWLDEYMKPADIEIDEPSPKERLRARLAEPTDLGDVDAPDFTGRYEGEIRDTSIRQPVSIQRHISPSDQRKIDDLVAAQKAQNALLGEPAVQTALRRDSPLEEDRGDRYAREVAMSDSRAKAEAYQMGVEAGARGQRTMSGPRGYADPTTDIQEGRAAVSTMPKPTKVAPEPTWLESTKKRVEGGIDEAAARARDVARAAAGDAPRTTSDPSVKMGMRETPMADANRSMAPSVYEYKPEFAAKEGQRPGEKNVGPMADRMERDPIAKTAIIDTGGKDHLLAIDKSKGLKLVMGGLADLQRQVDQMKRRRA